LSSGVYTVGAEGADVARSERSGVDVSTGRTVEAIDFLLARGGGVEGSVRSRVNGLPLSSVILRLEGEDRALDAMSDPNGGFSFIGLAAGAYVLRASGAEVMTATTGLEVTAGTTQAIDITLGPRGTVRGIVADTATGAPVPRVIVRVIGEAGPIGTPA